MGQGRFFPTPFGRTSNHHSSDSDMLQERTKPLCFTRVLVSSFCAVRFALRGTGGGVLLAQLRCELVQVLLCFFFSAFDERLEEVRLRGRQGLRPHVHRLDVFLERFGFARESLIVPLKIVSASAVS